MSGGGAPASPCIGLCQVDAQQVCLGCGRHIDEIVEWAFVEDDRKSQILEAARQRLAALYPDRPSRARSDDSPRTK